MTIRCFWPKWNFNIIYQYSSDSSWIYIIKITTSRDFLFGYYLQAYPELKDRLAPKKGKKVTPEIPTHCNIYVAKEYPAWQAACLSILREGLEKQGKMYDNKVR